MNAVSSPGNPSGKRVTYSGCAAWLPRLLRMFWVTELALLAVVVYGLRAGWSTPRQWSDGLFFDAVAQMMVAGVILLMPLGDAYDASWLRYVDHGDVEETRYQLFLDTMRRKQFGLRAFLGGMLTMLFAALALLF